MACCAIAVFLLGQLYMAWEIVARHLGIATSATTGNAATDWYLGAEPPQAANGRSLHASLLLRLALAGALCSAALATAFYHRVHIEQFDLKAFLADPARICGSAFS